MQKLSTQSKIRIILVTEVCNYYDLTELLNIRYWDTFKLVAPRPLSQIIKNWFIRNKLENIRTAKLFLGFHQNFMFDLLKMEVVTSVFSRWQGIPHPAISVRINVSILIFMRNESYCCQIWAMIWTCQQN
jgi:hypothetical protein